MRTTALIRWILTIAAIASAAPAATDDVMGVASNRVVVGYFPEWGVYARNYHITNLPAALLTHINYAFLRPVYDAATGTARIEVVDEFAALEKTYPGDSNSLAFRGSFHQLRKLKTAHPHLKTLISVGGATLSEDFSDIAASATARKTFAESCLAYMIRYGFDGIDIDWEYPVKGGERSVRHRPEDAANNTLLLRALRERLDAEETKDGRHYFLTIATSVTGETLTNRYQLPQLSKEVDWFNLMAYNMTGAWSPVTGHQAPLYGNPQASHKSYCVADGIAQYIELNVPRHKLVLGVPFYGRGFQGVPGTGHGLFQKYSGLYSEGSWSPSVFTYRDLRDGSQGHASINTNGFEEFWDSASKASFLYNHQTHVFITYASPRALALKAAYVRDQKLRGMMCWSLDLDTEDHELLKTLSEALETP